MRAHTATHLLHAQLATIFPQTKQAGSLVDEDYLRFDFYADVALTQEQIDAIEQTINTQITQALPVDVQEMSYDTAIQAGAKAFFEDKYGNMVRVVSIGDKLSVELCGGTHVSNTAHIGTFAIIGQESVAA
jgi:alanyl-tRNA synthetase